MKYPTLFIFYLNLIWILQTGFIEADYTASPHEIQKLVKVEQKILSIFTQYKKNLEDRIELIEEYLDDFSSSVLDSLPKPENELSPEEKLIKLGQRIAAHPIMISRLIRRFMENLKEIVEVSNGDIEKDVIEKIQKLQVGVEMPSIDDMKGAIEGLFRLIDTYDLNITEISQGKLLTLETYSGLRAYDCYHLAHYAMLTIGQYSTAVKFLDRAYRMVRSEGDQSVHPDGVFNALEKARLKHNEIQLNEPNHPYVFPHQIPKLSPSYTDEEINITKPPRPQTFILNQAQETVEDLKSFAALCSGKQLLPQSVSKDLHCKYKFYRNNPIYFEKVEYLLLNPVVVQIYNVITNDEIERLIHRATPFMGRSKVQGTTSQESETVSSVRTSSTTWIPERTDELLYAIPFRVQRITGLHTIMAGAAEDLQVSSYGIGGHYSPHFDYLHHEQFISTLPQLELDMGDRLATFMFYLSDVELGGGTAFPRLGVHANPVKGSAIFWFNLHEDGTKNLLSLHGGCPVLYGIKHVANKWIRMNAQAFRHKCEPFPSNY